MVAAPLGVNYLDRAVREGLLRIQREGRYEKIVYVGSAEHTEKWTDSEEKVRGEFYAELVYRYQYNPSQIAIEVSVPRRTPNDRADIVVYRDPEHTEPFIVIECKRDSITDAEFLQAIEQACGNRASLGAPYAGVIAGATRRNLDFTKYKSQERQKNIIADLPIRYGRPPEYRFLRAVPFRDLSAVPREELRAAIRKSHQTLWEGGRRSPIAAFGEFSKIVFVKIRDELDLRREKGQPYAFQRRTEETAEELALRIYSLYAEEQRREPDVFSDGISVDPPILAQVVEHLEGISLSRTDLDTKGVAFEEFLGGFFKGDFGQYFTPRELIAFAVQMIPVTIEDYVLDPACGSGGFLLYALDYIRREAERRFPGYEDDPTEREQYLRYWHEFAQRNLFGIEINEELTRVAKMNMIIHDDGHTNIVGHDALDFMDTLGNLKRELRGDSFDLVYTNPPFGSVVKLAEKGEDYLEQFEMRYFLGRSASALDFDDSDRADHDPKRGGKVIKARTSLKTEVLFLERVWRFLKPGTGRAAVVIPDGILTNASLQGVRDWVLAHFQVLAVVSLPPFAFQHYDAGVKASIIFLRRRNYAETPSDDEPIFMGIADNIGYDATGRKTFSVELEEEGDRHRTEIHHCDLFSYRVYYEWSEIATGKDDWAEKYREVIPNTGLVAQFHEFLRNPASFFA